MAQEEKELSIEMRTLLAFALSSLVLVVWGLFSPKPKPQPPAKTEIVKTQPAAPTATAPASRPAKPAAPPVAVAVAPKRAETESVAVVENDLYEVKLSNRGGVVRSWILKAYKDKAGQPLNVVNGEAVMQALGPPLAWHTEDPALRDQLNGALFAMQQSSPRAPATLLFEFRDGTVSAKREYRFEHGDYVVQLRSELTRDGKPVAHELVWRGGFGDHTLEQGHLTNLVTIGAPLAANQVHAAGDIKSETKTAGAYAFVTIEDLFFAAAFMPGPQGALIPAARMVKDPFKTAKGEDTPLLGVGTGGWPDGVNEFRAFVGPKDLDIIGKIAPDPKDQARLDRGERVASLGSLVDFGWFSFIAYPLFLALHWTYDHVVPNYGWAIVLLTVVINFALFPLKLSSMKSAMKMQKLAPRIKEIQERYKKYKLNDPRRQEQNQEVMALYKQHGVNPVGGCIPLLLQIPFLYGFYKVLSLSIEMRQAPWILWIRDLSTPEQQAFKVLPLLMIGTMVVLQKMTPQTTTDPIQQKMLTLMPLMFGVMFYNVSSGLVLYWLVGNFVQIAQQWYINRSEIGKSLQPAKA
jgi:YidC/Oxa1 family membrane protein insertase